MRVFLAIDIPEEVKKDLGQQLSAVRKEYPYLVWVPEEHYHLTLHFFGEVSYDDVGKIKKELEFIVYDKPQFFMHASYLDLFIDRKILVYLGFSRQKKLEEIESRIKEAFHTTSQSKKKFIPHVTLARYKIPSKQQYLLLKKKAQQLDIEASFKVAKITLYESILTGKVPVYHKLASFTLPKQ